MTGYRYFMASSLFRIEHLRKICSNFIYVVFQERHWTSPGMAAVLQAAINTPQSDRLKHILRMAPRFLDAYFSIALRDVNNCMLDIALILH